MRGIVGVCTRVVAGLAFGAVAAAAADAGAEPTMEERCSREVIETHEFLEAWSNGELSNDDATYERFASVIAPGFVIIDPDGVASDRSETVAALRAAHGRWSPPGRITIENLRFRAAAGELCLVSYVERHSTPAGESGWTSSAVFKRAPGTANGVAWFHLAEVGLPPAE